MDLRSYFTSHPQTQSPNQHTPGYPIFRHAKFCAGLETRPRTQTTWSGGDRRVSSHEHPRQDGHVTTLLNIVHMRPYPCTSNRYPVQAPCATHSLRRVVFTVQIFRGLLCSTLRFRTLITSYDFVSGHVTATEHIHISPQPSPRKQP